MNKSEGLNADRRIQLAILTSILSKFVMLAVQLAALPLALKALGVERFGAFVMITALLSWISLTSAGLFPGLTREISKSDPEVKEYRAKLFTVAFYIVLALSLVTGLVISVVISVVPVAALFGEGFQPYENEIRIGAYLAVGVLVLQVITGVAEATRAGLQQQHISNLWGAAGNLLSIVMLIVAALWVPTIAFLVLAVHGSVAIAKLTNFIHLVFIGTSGISVKWDYWDKSIAKKLASVGSAFLLVQIAAIASQQISVFVVGYISGPKDVAVFSIMLRLTVIMGGIVIMFTQPVWPAISASLHNGEISWAKNRAKLLVYGVFIYAVIVGLFVAFQGKWLIQIWIGSEISPTTTLLALTGAYFVVVVWNHVNYTLLVAVGRAWLPAVVLITEACLMLGLSLWLVPKYGAEGGMWALLIAGLVITGWIAPLSVKHAFLKL